MNNELELVLENALSLVTMNMSFLNSFYWIHMTTFSNSFPEDELPYTSYFEFWNSAKAS